MSGKADKTNKSEKADNLPLCPKCNNHHKTTYRLNRGNIGQITSFELVCFQHESDVRI